MEEKGEIRLFDQVFSRKCLHFYILWIRFERCVLQNRWKLELGFPSELGCASAWFSTRLPVVWSASGGQWGVWSRKCWDIEENVGVVRKKVGLFSRNVGAFLEEVGDILENVGDFLRNVGEKRRKETRTDVICLRKMEHCAAVPSYEICRCCNENFENSKYMCKFVRVSCNSQTLEFQAWYCLCFRRHLT